MFDTKEGIFGGPAWNRESYDRAREHFRNEENEKRRAERRMVAAKAGMAQALRDLIESIPDGAGADAAAFVPWSSLARDDDWYMRPGAHIAEGVKEAMDLARILGKPVTLRNVNGADLVVRLGESFDAIATRYRSAGGVGLG